jgi:hypothetical protein
MVEFSWLSAMIGAWGGIDGNRPWLAPLFGARLTLDRSNEMNHEFPHWKAYLDLEKVNQMQQISASQTDPNHAMLRVGKLEDQS